MSDTDCMPDRLTAESLRAAWDKMGEQEDRRIAERRERRLQVEQHPHVSAFGKWVDQQFVQGGPMIMHPHAARQFEETLVDEERRHAAGEESAFSRDDMLRLELAGWIPG